jgi:hypothetical protein
VASLVCLRSRLAQRGQDERCSMASTIRLQQNNLLHLQQQPPRTSAVERTTPAIRTIASTIPHHPGIDLLGTEMRGVVIHSCMASHGETSAGRRGSAAISILVSQSWCHSPVLHDHDRKTVCGPRAIPYRPRMASALTHMMFSSLSENHYGTIVAAQCAILKRTAFSDYKRLWSSLQVEPYYRN